LNLAQLLTSTYIKDIHVRYVYLGCTKMGMLFIIEGTLIHFLMLIYRDGRTWLQMRASCGVMAAGCLY